MAPAKRWWREWIAWGLAGCVADVLFIGFGMGVAFAVPLIGLALGLWAAWLAWRGSDDRSQVLPLSLWGGLVSADIATHFTIIGELGLFLLLGPQEIGRPILDELTGVGLGFLQGLVPPFLNSVGAFWIVQTMTFGMLELLCGVAAAWAGAKLLLARDARLAHRIERTWERLPKGLAAGLLVGGTAAVLGATLFIVSRGLPLIHLLLAVPLGALAGWLTRRWDGGSQARGQLTLAGLLASVLMASSVVGIFALFTVASPAGRTTLSAVYADWGATSQLIPHWLDPLWVSFPLLSALFTVITVSLTLGGSLGIRRWGKRD